MTGSRDFSQKYGWLALIMIVAAALRFHKLDFQSVWHDEIFSLNEARPDFSISQLWDAVIENDAHPPFYFILLHFVFKIFGYTTYVLRAFSAVTGILTIPAIFLLGREMFNRRIGLYAAALLSFNYFHITYSQEGRVYALLCLMAILSFYFLVRFIRRPTAITAVMYSVGAAMMIYCHLFGLFTLCAQYLILLYFIFRPRGVSQKRFFIYTFFAGLGTLLLYLPMYSVIKKAAGAQSSWIPMPTLDVYTQMFKDFFGQSEMVMLFVLVLLAIYFFVTLRDDSARPGSIDPVNDRNVFGFLILFTWIIVTLLLPLVRTYTALPFLINRYFIGLLPPVLIMVAIGLDHVRNSVTRYAILCTIAVFSYVDIVYLKKYYKTVTKTQFRELSQFIIDNNEEKYPVVARISYALPFFLDNDTIRMQIVTKWFGEFIDEMRSGQTQPFTFWYIDGHIRPEELTDDQNKYLSETFTLEKSVVMYNGWVRFYRLNESPSLSD